MTRETHTLDASDKVLGRLATEIANLLRGKHKIGFTYHQDHGDKVIVLNADKVKLTGRKETQKKYYRHSGYPGGLREISYLEMKAEHPERIIQLAVQNMLPDNRLRAKWLERLTIKVAEKEKI
ncbi:MAG TPA: 50S ribosomal protein L13 [Candidatus Saccharimonadales bacterium]|nr:50S ribosomal protein L13 [Candidatus Saccharimonadales bacterium]